ncbi:hypothetical protein INT48_002513 [Thamnidium elegans]|uniref:F-box domain-containing protein n=1 Tax=Thamnidium elegans TaxID=101142 RepID=A0A8H7W0A0_9FUNG|nr:hypothetical protein INT48_002513 [Thamnidium elegans]
MTVDRNTCTIFDLSLDIKYVILDFLDNRSLAHLAQTCRYFESLVRNVISFRNVQVSTLDIGMSKVPPFLNYRAGVCSGSTFYMPFINEGSLCYTFDLKTGIWSSHKLNMIDIIDIQPQITSAAIIGTKIYLLGGRLLKSYTLSNALIEIDINNFNTRLVKDSTGLPPRPRHEHSIDSVGDRYLIVFGGLCYNSVGENDVFVYDTFENRWFVPPISGRHVPHLRFGHASTTIGNNLYIHGGAQLDNDSRYIVYDDLYKLDCQTWVWYKYEHPEVERYLRSQKPTPGESPQRNHLISTTGDSPHDRFQPYMCSYGNKLIIFGGHSIREDEDDNEILCSYSIDEVCIFNTKRRAWSNISATTLDKDEEAITVCDMSIATVQLGSRGLRIYIFAGKKAPEIQRSGLTKFSTSSSSNGSGQESVSVGQHQPTLSLPSITENVSPTQSCHDDDNSDEAGENEVRGPDNSDDGDLFHVKNASSSSHSSYSSSNGSLGQRNRRHNRRATPCIAMLDMIE